jgi:polyisoprenoid-binding protein YceI
MSTQTIAAAPQTTWTIDAAHTEVGFEVKHLMISRVRGRFGAVTGTIVLDAADPSRSSVEASIETASVDTRQEQRDAHLRSADFFDVENHPAITFRSRAVEPAGAGRFRVTGDLAIRGVSREVALDVSDDGRGRDPWGGERAAFSASLVIDRRDFGLTWNQALETGGLLVANDIRITLDVQAVAA